MVQQVTERRSDCAVKCRGRFVDAVREQRCEGGVMRREFRRPDLRGRGRWRRRWLRLPNRDDALLLWFVLFSMCFIGKGITALAAQTSGSYSMYSAGPSDSLSDLFSPIQISPSVVPHALAPMVPAPPMYPYFPSSPHPVLTGRCPVNISAITHTVDKTAADCCAPLATLLGNVICCPQLDSMLRIFQGEYSAATGSLVLNKTVAKDCFKDLTSVLISSGANGSISSLCSIKSFNLTGGSCPIKTLVDFEQTVNTSKLLDACTTVDSLLLLKLLFVWHQETQAHFQRMPPWDRLQNKSLWMISKGWSLRGFQSNSTLMRPIMHFEFCSVARLIKAEVNFLGQLRHANLVKLIGYCMEDDQRLLVYEYMRRGSLENHLFRSG